MKALLQAFIIIIIIVALVFVPYSVLCTYKAQNYVELYHVSSQLSELQTKELQDLKNSSSEEDFCTIMLRDWNIPKKTAQEMYNNINNYGIVRSDFKLHNNTGFALHFYFSFCDQQDVYIQDWFPFLLSNYIDKGEQIHSVMLCYKIDDSVKLDETMIGIEYSLIFNHRKYVIAR